jgi:acetoin utilization deacetylase AcuC-like enzyme
MRVGIYDDPVFREHDSGPGHPERPERLDAVRRGLREARLEERLTFLPTRPATQEELLRVHSDVHVRAVEATRGRIVAFDPDTQAGPRTCDAALHAAGCVVDATSRVLGGELDRAFCLSRPPGHHAERDRVMGFCYFNNVAVAAAEALARGLERVLVVDFDVHHGNGTQDIFHDDPRVLYISSHAYPFYPGTGPLEDVGRGAGQGFTVNLPMPYASGDAEYLRVYREVVTPIAKAYDPELVLVSAGFDAFDGDPLAGMRVSAEGYGALAALCVEAAAGAARGRVVAVLEGGYHLDGLATSAAAVTRALLGEPPPAPAGEAHPVMDRLVAAFRERLVPFWPALS